MRAAILRSPGNIDIENVPDPILKSYDVLCQTLASAVCAGTDYHIFNNHPYFKVRFPCIIGHEGIGRVISCGRNVRYFSEGDIITRVVNRLPTDCGIHIQYGAFAEKSIATDWLAMKEDGLDSSIWRKSTIHRSLPPHYDPIESTMIITWRETFSFLKRMTPNPNNTLAIIGSGANALSFANHAMNEGIQPIVIGSLNREHLFKQIGIDFVISYQVEDYIKQIHDIGLDKIDIIIDSIGDSKTLCRILPILSVGGKVGVYGLNSFHNYSIQSSLAPGDFMYFSGEIYDEGSVHDDIISFINDKKLNAWNYLSRQHIYPLEKINDAINSTINRQAMKSVVLIKSLSGNQSGCISNQVSSIMPVSP